MRTIADRIQQRYGYSLILLKQLVKTDFKLRYQGSVLGYVWSLLKPTLLFVILYVVFSIFLRLGDEIPHFSVYLLLGIVVWTYFSEVTVNGVSSIVSSGDILRKINFPKYIIVLAGSFSGLINLALNSIVIMTFIAMLGISVGWDVLFLPLIILELFVFTLSLSFFLSATFVRLRDISYIWEVFLQGAFYATPILYPVQVIRDVSEVAAKLFLLNPMAQMIQDMRYILITEKTTTIDQLYGGHWIRIVPVGLTLLFALFAASYFRKRSKFFAEDL